MTTRLAIFAMLFTVGMGGTGHSQKRADGLSPAEVRARLAEEDRIRVAIRDRTPPIEAFVRESDRQLARQGRWDLVCYRNLPTERCYRMSPARRMAGVWIDEFEGSQFLPGRTVFAHRMVPAAERERQPQIWLTIDRAALPRGFGRTPTGRQYRIEFIGRRTKYRGFYGHLGMSDFEIVVDRVLSIRPIKPG